MSLLSKSAFTVASLGLAMLGACAGPADYSRYLLHRPRSLLVLPPLNDSIDADASYVYLSTITRPLAEMGYYVFPVAVVDAYMKDNGLPTPYEMHAVSLKKLGSVFGSDAVLYVQIEDWGQKYQILTSNTVVKARARLVDVKSGETLWQGRAEAVEGSRSGGSDIVGMLVGAAVDQVVGSTTNRARSLAVKANRSMISIEGRGLLYGPYHPKFGNSPESN